MAFHGILVLRDEADLIGEVLEHLLTWVDSLSLYDTGSTDGTWEIVQELAGRDRRLALLGREDVPYDNGLRALAFERARSRFRDGDWIARLDADEFYHVPPPRLVADRLAPGDGRLFAQMYDFLITHEEARAWDEGRESLADRTRSIESRRRRYLVQEFPEPRLFRYRRTMRWPATSYVPLCGGPVATARIPVRHYRWRDPVQAAARCALRSAARARGIMVGDHWAVEDWHDWLADERDPLLLTHTPGAPLPDPALTNHLPRGARAAAQRVLYGSGIVGLVDRFLPGFDPTWKPGNGQPQTAR